MIALIPGDVAMPIEQLRQAVPGLAGIAGLLLFPTLGAWVRLLLEFLEWNRPGLTRPKRISGVALLRSVLLTLMLAFFTVTLFRAAGELRDVQAEAPVVGPSMQGIVVGVVIWAIYAIGFSALRREARRRSNERRIGGGLR
jgi:hypothetical protein